MNSVANTPETDSAEQEVAEMGKTDFLAVMTQKEIEEYENTQNESWGVKRRLAFITMARSKTQLVEGFGHDGGPDSLLNLIDEISDWSTHMKGHIEMAESACARLMIVASALIYSEQTQGATA